MALTIYGLGLVIVTLVFVLLVAILAKIYKHHQNWFPVLLRVEDVDGVWHRDVEALKITRVRRMNWY